MQKVLDNLPVSPMDTCCPRCGAKPGSPGLKLRDEVELIHIERIDAALR